MEKTWIEKAAEIVPSPRQVAWNCMEFYGFVHFGLYTFDREHEFATGPEIFNPVNFDARQWDEGLQGSRYDRTSSDL